MVINFNPKGSKRCPGHQASYPSSRAREAHSPCHNPTPHPAEFCVLPVHYMCTSCSPACTRAQARTRVHTHVGPGITPDCPGTCPATAACPATVLRPAPWPRRLAACAAAESDAAGPGKPTWCHQQRRTWRRCGVRPHLQVIAPSGIQSVWYDHGSLGANRRRRRPCCSTGSASQDLPFASSSLMASFAAGDLEPSEAGELASSVCSSPYGRSGWSTVDP